MDFSTYFANFWIHVILPKKQQKLCEDFREIDDLHERLAAVVDRARRSPTLPPAERTDAHRVRGCISPVWLTGELRGGRCYFRCDADGPLVKGLVALLCDFFSGATPAEIVASDADPLTALDLVKNLSPTRRNGIASARALIVAFAETHKPVAKSR
jgi:cysteine desulfuration protein SufE